MGWAMGYINPLRDVIFVPLMITLSSPLVWPYSGTSHSSSAPSGGAPAHIYGKNFFILNQILYREHLTWHVYIIVCIQCTIQYILTEVNRPGELCQDYFTTLGELECSCKQQAGCLVIAARLGFVGSSTSLLDIPGLSLTTDSQVFKPAIVWVEVGKL